MNQLYNIIMIYIEMTHDLLRPKQNLITEVKLTTNQ